MCIVNMTSRCTHEESPFVSLDGSDNIFILLDEGNNLEEDSTHLYNEVSFSIFKFEKKHNQ